MSGGLWVNGGVCGGGELVLLVGFVACYGTFLKWANSSYKHTLKKRVNSKVVVP